ncbi:hypothetical protein NMY22_g19399 [Coprinellus aureogranulatus]|nr:hypothetical protein NMY22_g19399 [Coprinellus aureogranulatus]
MEDSSIGYLDFQDQLKSDFLTPKCLIPPPHKHKESTLIERLSFDVDTTNSPTYHFSEFNIAVGVRFQPAESDSGASTRQQDTTTRIDVWRVKVVEGQLHDDDLEEATGGTLQVQEHLATVLTPNLHYHNVWQDFCLLGTRIAYAASVATGNRNERQSAVEIVDWKTPVDIAYSDTGSSPTHRHWLVPTEDSDISDIYLLPEGRILFRDASLYIYDYAVSTAGGALNPALWQSKLQDEWVGPSDCPSILNDGEVRFVLRNQAGLYTIILLSSSPKGKSTHQASPEELGTNPVVVQSLRLDGNRASQYEFNHHNRTIDVRRLRCYHHPFSNGPGSCVLNESVIKCDAGFLELPPSCYPPDYDVFSQRAVYFDTEDSTFTIVELLVGDSE